MRKLVEFYRESCKMFPEISLTRGWELIGVREPGDRGRVEQRFFNRKGEGLLPPEPVLRGREVQPQLRAQRLILLQQGAP